MPSSATGTPPRWSARTARSTGSACRGSTPPPASRGCSATTSHGHWQLEPTAELRGRRAGTSTTRPPSRRPSPPTTGAVTLLDVMPTGDHRADVVRRVTGVSGTVRMRHEWVVRIDYGADHARGCAAARSTARRSITAVAGPDKLVLRGPRLPIAHEPPPRRRVRRRGRGRAHLLDDLDPVVRAHAAERRPADRGDDRRRRARGRRGATTTCRTRTSSAARCSRCA